MDKSELTTKIGEPGAPPPGRPYISAAEGRHAGRLYPVEPGAARLLGRSAECNPRFPTAERVSKVQAEVTVDGDGRAWLRDMSRNGTLVGTRLVHGGRVELRHGDWIILGEGSDALRAEWLSDGEVGIRLLPFVDQRTGLSTPRQLQMRLDDVLDSKEDLAEPLSALMMDIDHFGRFNKSHGQTTGDAVLTAVGACLLGAVRELHPAGDPGRLGGEEFLILLPRCPLPRAVAIAEECRVRIAALALERGGHPLRITASFGVATCRPSPGLTLDGLTELANPHLIRAKDGGRNRTCWPGDDAPQDA